MKTKLKVLAAIVASLASNANADVITDWNAKTHGFIGEAKLGTPPAVRLMAIVQTAAHAAATLADGINTANQANPTARGNAGASVEAAVAAANRAALVKLLPAQQAAIDAAYQSALTAIADGASKAAGIAAGEKAAADVFAQRADDKPGAEAYRPYTGAGIYVPTAAPAVPTWSQRKPWLMTSVTQFRPAAPPGLTTDAWAAQYNEVKAIGSQGSTQRTPVQTEIAHFWEYSLPSIYYGVVRSVADQPGRDIVRNARLYAAVAQAMDDAMISVFEAKYHYNFWRPSTAIRNGDMDGHDGTQRDASWTSLIDAPMHPEYPSGHGILAGAVGAVLKADVGAGSMPVLSTSSPSAKGATRRWISVDDFVREVGDSRVYAGIHYRVSIDAGADMGRRIGELAATKVLAAGGVTKVAAFDTRAVRQ